MAGVLYVVARHREDIFDYLRASFADEEAVCVVFDRRVDERRRSPAPADDHRHSGRRRAERRTPARDADLRDLGWFMVKTVHAC